MSESKILPNSFFTPNMHVDDVMHLLSGDEYKVLNFITRHILGWQEKVAENKAIISLTMITDGYQSKKTGKHFNGVGLSRPTVVKILDSLTVYGLIEPIDSPTAKGQVWSLGLYPDLELLYTRHREKSEGDEKRMLKIRPNADKSDLLVNDINQPQSIAFTTPSQSDLRKQRHMQRQSSKTERKEIALAARASDFPLQGNPDDLITDAEAYQPLPLKGKEKSTAQTIQKPRKPQTAQDKDPLPKVPPKGFPAGDEPPAPKIPRPRSAKQIERDEAMELLAAAMGVTLTKADYALYAKVSRELIESTIPASEFKTYVQRVRKSADGKWTVTINSLIANGRPSEYVTARNAYNAQQGAKKTPHVYLGQEVSKNAYNPASDPAYVGLQEKSS